MRIVATTTAFPPNYYTQDQVVEELKNYWNTAAEHTAALERLHARTGVEMRHFSRPLSEYSGLDTWGKTNNVWIEVAEQLGEQAINDLLLQTGVDREQIGAIFFVSVTGICSPSIDARLVNRMGLNRAIKRNPIFGLGCVAGAAGLSRAADYVRAYPDQVAILLSVELCSLTWQRGDYSVANLIASGLFGDGAAAVLVAGSEVKLKQPDQGPRIIASAASFYPNTQDVMGWAISEKGFNIILSPDVPKVVTDNLARDVDGLLASKGLKRSDIGNYIMHTGGPKVLEANAQALGLPNEALAASWDSLRKNGNLSSASVLLVLDDTIRNRRPPAGTLSLLGAMGPGFCAELLLLEWT